MVLIPKQWLSALLLLLSGLSSMVKGFPNRNTSTVMGDVDIDEDTILRQMLVPLLSLQHEFSDRPAYIYNFASVVTTKTHGDLHRDADIAAGVMRQSLPHPFVSDDNDSKLYSGPRVLIAASFHASYEAQVALLACFKNAYVHMPVANVISHPRFYPESLDILDPSLILIDSETYQNFPFLEDWGKRKGRPLLSLDIDKVSPVGIPSMLNETSSEASFKPQHYDPESFPLDNMGSIMFSSGSTGTPKMAAHSFRSSLNTIRKRSEGNRFSNGAIVHTPSGTEDWTVNTKVFLPSVLYGSTVLGASRGMDTNYVDLQALYENEEMMKKLTYYIASPIEAGLWVDVLKQRYDHGMALTHLRMIETSGSKLYDAVRDKIASFFGISEQLGTDLSIESGHPAFIEAMGTSEAFWVGTRNAVGPPGFDIWDGVEINIKPINASAREMLALPSCDEKDDCVPGEFFVRTNTMMMGYLQKVGQHPIHTFDVHGWWGTGDIAYIDKDSGKYHLVGRSRKTINVDGDELDPTVIHDSWAEVLPFAEEMLLVRDDNNIGTNQAPVLFCKASRSNAGNSTDKSPLNSLDQVIDWIEDKIDTFDWTRDKYKSHGLWATSAVLFVDEFPRTGGRRKIDGPKVQKLYMSSIKPALLATGDIQDDVDHRAVAFLKWNQNNSNYELIEWNDTERSEEAYGHIVAANGGVCEH